MTNFYQHRASKMQCVAELFHFLPLRRIPPPLLPSQNQALFSDPKSHCMQLAFPMRSYGLWRTFYILISQFHQVTLLIFIPITTANEQRFSPRLMKKGEPHFIKCGLVFRLRGMKLLQRTLKS